jgi:hypothetical protein
MTKQLTKQAVKNFIKQETLEEAAESWLKSKTLLKSSQAPGLLIGFIEGAKWQQEQIYNQIKELYDNENITGFTKRAYAICLDIVEQFNK